MSSYGMVLGRAAAFHQVSLCWVEPIDPCDERLLLGMFWEAWRYRFKRATSQCYIRVRSEKRAVVVFCHPSVEDQLSVLRPLLLSSI